MTFKFFVPQPQTIEELKKQYKKLAFKHHPDCGGTNEDMKQVNAEYDYLFQRVKNKHINIDGETYEAKTKTTEAPEEFREIISRLVTIPGIKIELIGNWLWLTGDTKAHKEIFKKLGFKWSNKKSAWYYHGKDYIKKSKKTFSLDEIRSLYGNEEIAGYRPQAITA